MEQQVSEITPGGPPAPALAAGAAAAAVARSGAGALGALRALGPVRLAALGAVALALLGFFTYLVLRVGAPDYALLYGGLDLAESGAIVSRLEGMGVPYRLRGDGGDAILVPRERVHRLRMALAEEGLLRGGTVGYEIFDSTSALGTSNFLADVNLKRALEGELARTVAALDDVRAARVHLVLPKRELFRRERVDPSASVMLRMQRGVEPSRRQVLAVQHVVAAAVPGLRPEQVAVADERGTLLARGGGDGGADGALLPAQNEEFKAAYEERLRRTIEELLARSLGPGRVRAEVHADIDFDRVETTSESFDPDSQVARSTQSVEEETRSSEQDRNDAVSVGNNLPNEGAALGGGSTSSEQTTRSEETVNFEISRTVRNQVKVGGQVRRLSVAVLVDGTYGRQPGAAGGGERVYRPRGEEELARLATLVRSAVGFDAGRGDTVEVINMPFAEPEQVEPAAEGWGGLAAADLRRLTEILALALVAALLVLFVLRPAVGRLLPAPAEADALPRQRLAPAGAGGDAAHGALAGPEARPALPAAAGGGVAGEGERPGGPEEENGADAQARLLREVLEFVERSPDEAASIVRGWLHEG